MREFCCEQSFIHSFLVRLPGVFPSMLDLRNSDYAGSREFRQGFASFEKTQ